MERASFACSPAPPALPAPLAVACLLCSSCIHKKPNAPTVISPSAGGWLAGRIECWFLVKRLLTRCPRGNWTWRRRILMPAFATASLRARLAGSHPRRRPNDTLLTLFGSASCAGRVDRSTCPPRMLRLSVRQPGDASGRTALSSRSDTSRRCARPLALTSVPSAARNGPRANRALTTPPRTSRTPRCLWDRRSSPFLVAFRILPLSFVSTAAEMAAHSPTFQFFASTRRHFVSCCAWLGYTSELPTHPNS